MKHSAKPPSAQGSKDPAPGRPADGGVKKSPRAPARPEEHEPVRSWAGFVIRLERLAADPDEAVVVALLAARLPGTDLLSHARILAAALALAEAHGFTTGDAQFKARPTVDVTQRFPKRPADWSSHRLEVWFTDFTQEGRAWVTAGAAVAQTAN